MARVSIEDCLNYMENRFALVAVASDRTRKIMKGASTFVHSKNKEAVTALREIADGHIVARDPMASAPAPVAAEAVEVTPAAEAPAQVVEQPAEAAESEATEQSE